MLCLCIFTQPEVLHVLGISLPSHRLPLISWSPMVLWHDRRQAGLALLRREEGAGRNSLSAGRLAPLYSAPLHSPHPTSLSGNWLVCHCGGVAQPLGDLWGAGGQTSEALGTKHLGVGRRGWRVGVWKRLAYFDKENCVSLDPIAWMILVRWWAVLQETECWVYFPKLKLSKFVQKLFF